MEKLDALIRELYREPHPDPFALTAQRTRLLHSIGAGQYAPPPAGQPRVIPHLIYDDVAAALDWLSRAFGFVEAGRMLEQDGSIGHADMLIGDSMIMMGPPSVHGSSPQRGVSTMVHVYVDDIDRHYERARKSGARIVIELRDEPWGARRYQAEDPEGHQWQFAQPLE